MAGQSILPAGDFRTSYAVDTTIFPTTTSRNALLLGIVLTCIAPWFLSDYWVAILIQIGMFGIASRSFSSRSHGSSPRKRSATS